MSFGVKAGEVHFVEGPLDGHCDSVPSGLTDLAQMIAIPININTLAALDGQPRRPVKPASSVALYELEVTEGVIRYRFVGSTTAQKVRLENWRG